MSTPHGAVVVGVDASADSERAVHWAAREAAARQARLHLVHALPLWQGTTPLPARQEQALRDAAANLLADATAKAGQSGAPTTTEIVYDRAAPALIAASERAAITVLGARGHGAISGTLLGSVSQHVSRHARCPVVVVREQADPGARRVVVGVDASPGSDLAIGLAFDIASRTDAPLVAVHAWQERRGSTAPARSSARRDAADRIDAGDRLISEALAGWAAKYPDVAVAREAVPVHPTRALADASEHAALVVVGSRGHGQFTGMLLGSVSQSVLHHARCPVAVAR